MSYLKEFLNAVKDQDFLILDTETTGLHDGEIVQIAIINNDGETLINSLVKPVLGIPQDAQRIHGISEETVKNAPSWAEISPQVKNLLDGRLLVVYNAIYDRKMMHQSAEKAGMEKTEWKEICTWHCAMEAYAEYFGDWNSYRQSFKWQKLSSAAASEGVVVENAHDALGDCLMTLGVVNSMLKGTKNATD